MAILKVDVALHAICLTLLFLFAGVNAQSTSPTNDSSSVQGDVGFLLSTTINNMATTIKIIPLTNNAGLVGSTTQLQVSNPTSHLLFIWY